MKPKISKDRLEVLNKIKDYESLGGEYLFKDVENDPPSKELLPDDVDYLKKKFKSKWHNFICKKIINKMLKNYAKEHQISVVGIENLSKVKSGAIITSNHFHYFDSSPIIYALKSSKSKRKLNIVIKEGNYQIPGKLGYILRNYNTFPLSSNMKTTINLNNAIDRVIKKGQLVLVYPEQSMWWNYKKPRKYRIGAFRWASRNNVPIIPCFTTMEDLECFEENGLPKQKLKLFIGEPIYPLNNLDAKENAKLMLEKNHKFSVKIYEEFYKQKYDLNIKI